MMTYHIGYEADAQNSGRIVCVSNGEDRPKRIGVDLTWLHVELDDAPSPQAFTVVAGELVGRVPDAAPAVQHPVPTREEFLSALYQQFLGSPAQMAALTQKAANAKKGKS